MYGYILRGLQGDKWYGHTLSEMYYIDAIHSIGTSLYTIKIYKVWFSYWWQLDQQSWKHRISLLLNWALWGWRYSLKYTVMIIYRFQRWHWEANDYFERGSKLFLTAMSDFLNSLYYLKHFPCFETVTGLYISVSYETELLQYWKQYWLLHLANI